LTGYLWKNDGNGFFTDASASVEIVPMTNPGRTDGQLNEYSFTPIFTDLNADLYPDLLLAGDFESSQILINNAGLSFSDFTTDVISDENGMGASIVDYDRDGDFDWFVSSIFHSGIDQIYTGGITGNRLYRNDGNGTFTDVTDNAQVRDGAWGWGSCVEDFDNDGYIDIFHTNGMHTLSTVTGGEDPYEDFRQDKSRLFVAQGDGTFLEQASAFGIDHSDQGRGVVCTDYDEDGLVDIFIANNGKPPTVYKNQITNSNHYLQIELIGSNSNRKGIGALVTVTSTSGIQVQQVSTGSSYLSQQPASLHFGLGADTTVTSVVVRWPDSGATTTTMSDIPADQKIVVSMN
jgi:hypothetical protein